MAHHLEFHCFDCNSKVGASSSVNCAHNSCSRRVCFECISVTGRGHEYSAEAALTVANNLQRRSAAVPHTIRCSTHVQRILQHEDRLKEVDQLQRLKLAVQHVRSTGGLQITAAAQYSVSKSTLSTAVGMVVGGHSAEKRRASDSSRSSMPGVNAKLDKKAKRTVLPFDGKYPPHFPLQHGARCRFCLFIVA